MQTRMVVLLLLVLAGTFQQGFATSSIITLKPNSTESIPVSLNSGDIVDVTFNTNSTDGPEAVTFAIIFVNSPPAPNDTVFKARECRPLFWQLHRHQERNLPSRNQQ